MKKIKSGLMLSFFSLLSGCVTFPTTESEQVKVIWDDTDYIRSCENKGVVFGSEGHFYDYWLHADKDMMWGTLNQMRIKAVEKGGDVLYLYQPLSFSTSVTMFANVYLCDAPIVKDKKAINSSD